jgi:hypothetical protein
MADPIKPDDPIALKMRKYRENWLPMWKGYRGAMNEEEAFLLGDRYTHTTDAYNKDRRLIQIKGQEIQDTTRHVMGEVTKRPRSVEARPVDQQTDPDQAEIATSLIEWELGNPWKGFDDELEAAILSAREIRMGLVWMDWEPDKGPFGELLYRYGDPRRVMWNPAYPEPHHPMNNLLIEEFRMDVEEAKEKYDADWLVADRDPNVQRMRADQPLLPATYNDITNQGFEDNKVTLLKCWIRDDETPKDEKKPGDFIPFASPDDNYLSCKSRCGYRSETQGQLNEHVPDGEEPHALPTELSRACPRCNGDLQLIEGKIQQHEVHAFSQGKRLVIIPAFQKNPTNPQEDEPLEDGDWPIPTLRSFPVMVITSYQKPGKVMGPSDTTLMWDQQIASDQLATMAIQAVAEHRPYWVLPKQGLTDARDNRFEFRDDQFNVSFRDDSNDFLRNKPAIEVHSGPGLDPGFGQAWQMVQGKLMGQRGITDFGLTPENSKDIAASTVAQLTQQENIPIAHFTRRLHRQLSKFYGVVWDAIRYTYTSQRLSRLRMDDLDIVAPLSGDELPNFDFVIEETPDFTGLEKARSQAWDSAMAMVQQGAPPPIIEAWAQFHQIPKSVTRKLLMAVQEMQQQQQMQMQAAASNPPMAGPGAGPSMGPPPSNAGQMTSGMVPGAAA